MLTTEREREREGQHWALKIVRLSGLMHVLISLTPFGKTGPQIQGLFAPHSSEDRREYHIDQPDAAILAAVAETAVVAAAAHHGGKDPRSRLLFEPAGGGAGGAEAETKLSKCVLFCLFLLRCILLVFGVPSGFN